MYAYPWNLVMQTNSNLDELSDNLIRKIKSHLINHMAKTLDEASEDEFYRAISFAIREETMINWLATNRTMDKEDPRTIYYISMEYMPGRLFQNNITNLCSQDILKAVAQKCNRNLKKIASYEEDPGLGNGGLGRLASCFLDSLATKKYPAIAYGLRYQYGIFEQQIKYLLSL